MNIVRVSAGGSQRTELLVSRQCAELFGGETMDALIREFEEKNPGLRIKLSLPQQEQAHGKKTPAPQVVFFDEGQFAGLVQENALASLEPFFQEGAVFENMAAVSYAVPLVSFMDLLVYNIEILQKAGFARPPKTRAEFLVCARAAAKLNETASGGEARYGAAIGLGAGDPLAMRRDIYSWIWAAGADIPPLPEAGKQPEFSRTAEEIIAFFGQLGREGLLAPGSFEKTGAQMLEEFAAGKIAMMVLSTGDLPLLRKKMNAAALGITVIPAGLNSPLKNRSCLSALYAGISSAAVQEPAGKDGRSPAENAFAFIAFLAEKSRALSAGFPEEDPLNEKIRDVFEASSFIEGVSGAPRQPERDAIIREKLAALMPVKAGD